MTVLGEKLAQEIRASGPMPFDRFVERALYDPELGFYSARGRAGGRGGDFITSVEAGPLFGAVVGEWLDARWQEAGRPGEFRVSEVGAGVGTLYRTIRAARPGCLDALRYTLVEQSASMREAHDALPGEQWRSVDLLPDEPQHVIMANELLDNLAFGIAERTEAGWAAVAVAADDASTLRWHVGPASTDSGLDRLAPEAPVGAWVPTAAAAAAWIESAQRMADAVLVFDYAASTAELAARGPAGWLRTYGRHERGGDPLVAVGEVDITHDVPIDQLPVPTHQSTQADWLRSHGLARRVDDARRVWTERAHIGDLQAMKARSAIGEADALTDPNGLGGFVVLEWHRPR